MITVFTSTYNRAYSLPRLYQSLCIQGLTDFEWLIVDDGSTDQTEQLVQEWLSSPQFVIRYYKQENGGKHRAINKGVGLARGELFFIVDSDDYLPYNSLQTIDYFYQQIKNDPIFAGVSGIKCYPNGKRTGGTIHFDILDTDSVSLREKYLVKGDMAEAWKTSILQQFLFPEFINEFFLTEDVVWDQIALQHQLRYFNRNVYICEYLSDGLSRNLSHHHRNSPLGTMLYYGTSLRDSRFGVVRHIKDAIHYWRYTLDYRGKRDKLPLWVYLFYPLGWFFK